MKNHKRKGIASKQTISAASMGKALVLLATSCAALTTGRHAPATSCARVEVKKMGRSDTVLHYRDLDDYQMVSVDSSSSDASVGSMDCVATPCARVAISPILKSDPPSNEQIIMDEYLEYVEKRYSRMHRRKSITKPTAFVFPVNMISTLVYQSPSSTVIDNEALQALGLTGLISERLRTRLHAPREFRNEHESAVNFFHYLTTPAEKTDVVSTTPSGGRLSPHVSLSFLAQFRSLTESLRRIVTAYMTSLKVMGNFFARAVPAILEKGGLRHSVRMMSVVSVAILLTFRPLVRGFIKRA